jgi:hypothetical protein
MLQVGGFSLRRWNEQHGRHVKLAADIVGYSSRNAEKVIYVATIGSECAQLNRESETIVISSAAMDFSLISL